MGRKVNFTKAVILAARPMKPGERTVLLDAKTKGLQCRVTYSGIATFSVFRRVKSGRVERVTLGRFPDVSIEKARKDAEKIGACIADGGNPAEIKRAHRAEPTFNELFDGYLERHAKQNKRTWKSKDESNYRLYLEKRLGSRKISQIEDTDIAALIEGIAGQVRIEATADAPATYKIATANSVLVTVKSVFKWGMLPSVKLCKRNPASGIQKLKEKSRERFLVPEELPLFFDAVKAEEDKDTRDYIFLLLYTGVRKGNLLTMRWEEISFQQKFWRIERTKNGEPLVIALTDEVMDILQSRLDNGSVYVFPGKGKAGHMAFPREGWKNILTRSGIKNLRPHDLRRTLGSWQAITGSSAIVIGKSLGHKSPQATAIYARLIMDPVRKSVETAAQAMIHAAKHKSVSVQE